tara:strand:- start:910 stop:1233 length:324 start_codon:yes stop_codon:yes gene_type:complete
MTIHIDYNHSCSGCEALYIPFDEGIVCPKCGLGEPETFDYIPQAVASMKFNKADGRYRPGAWMVGSLGDHVLNLMFSLFDEFESEQQNEEFSPEIICPKWNGVIRHI